MSGEAPSVVWEVLEGVGLTLAVLVAVAILYALVTPAEVVTWPHASQVPRVTPKGTR